MVVELFRSKKYKLLAAIVSLILVFESGYCLLSLLFLKVIKNNPNVYSVIEISAYILIAFMGIWMLADKSKNEKAIIKNTLYRGIISIIIHPQQIPFWIIVGVVVNKLIRIDANSSSLYQFIFFNAVGATIALLLYMVFGTKLLNYLKISFFKVNKVMGAAYLLIAAYSLLTF
jgi:threonine/homoserine/homoserine lactone efflux protein